MPRIPKDDDLLTRYLLGDSLQEQEESSIEELLLKDDESLEHLSILEDEVIESHLRCELTQQYERLLQKQFDVSPRLRERVAWVKRHMMSSAGSGAQIPAALAGGPQPAISWWSSAQKAWQRHKLAGAVLAVALTMLAASFWVLMGRARYRELQRGLVEQRQTNQELRNQLETERNRRESFDQKLAQVQAGPELAIASLFLTPAGDVQTGQRRGTGVANVELTSQAALLQLQMNLSAVKYAKYRGAIETVEGQEVLTQNGLATAKINGKSCVVWEISTTGLSANDYVVSLYGIGLNGKRLLAGVFSFHLRKTSH